MNQTTNKTQTTGSSVRTRHMVQTAIFGVIIVIMAFTPFLGYIPLGFTRATIIHIPVILASLLMGPKTGALLGLLFGLTSFINNTVNPTVTSFVFTPFYSMGEFSGGIGSVIICFVPRILTGVVPHYIYKLVKWSCGESGLWIYSVDHRNQRSSGGDCCRSAHGIDRKNADEEKYERKTGIYTWF